MKVLGISGSPRKGGNTDILLDKALEGAKAQGASTEKITLGDLDLKPCQECGEYYDTCECPIDDDMHIIYRKVEEADAVILASPIFFGSVTAQVKIMIDRFQPYWIRKKVLKKPPLNAKARRGLFLCVSGFDKKDFFENAKSIVKIFFRVLDIEYYGDAFYGGIDGKGEIQKRKDALETAFELGKNIAKNGGI